MKLDFHQHRILRLRFSLQFQPDFIAIFSPYQRPLCRRTFGLRGVPLRQKPDANFLLGLRLHVPKHGFVRETLLSGLHHAERARVRFFDSTCEGPKETNHCDLLGRHAIRDIVADRRMAKAANEITDA